MDPPQDFMEVDLWFQYEFKSLTITNSICRVVQDASHLFHSYLFVIRPHRAEDAG